MHGDGVVERLLPWPDWGPRGPGVVWVAVAGRRFWCPLCRCSTRVYHPGVERGVTFGAAITALMLWLVGTAPVGKGWTELAIFKLVHEEDLSASERARAGKPRWMTLRRLAMGSADRWPAIASPITTWRDGADAFCRTFAPGGTLEAVLLAAVQAARCPV